MEQIICDMRITFKKSATGKHFATVRLLTPAEVRFHNISLPEGTPAYALYERCAQEAIQRLLSVPGSHEVALQCHLPV
jgi:hypothetical protein